jgi:hypothetical protein
MVAIKQQLDTSLIQKLLDIVMIAIGIGLWQTMSKERRASVSIHFPFVKHYYDGLRQIRVSWSVLWLENYLPLEVWFMRA